MPSVNIERIVSYAADHPLTPGHPLGNLHDYACRVAELHTLLLVVEWSPPHQQMMYHASISHDQGKETPEVGALLMTLMALEELLGAPAFFAYGEKIAHFFWQIEGKGAEDVPKYPAH